MYNTLQRIYEIETGLTLYTKHVLKYCGLPKMGLVKEDKK
jgi:hypothetical protein